MIFHTTSKRPVLIVGNGIRASGAYDILHEFYRKTKIPILTTMNAVDLMQGDDRLGFIGTYGHRVSNHILAESDLIIAIGARLGIRQVGNKKEYFGPHAKLIRADIDEYELGRNIKKDEEKYQADAKEFIEKLMREDIPVYEDWNRRCFEAKKILDNYDKYIGNLCIEEISKYLPEDPIVAVDVGQNQCWVAQSMVIRGNEGRILIGGGFGAMGCGLPFAIGASIGMNKKVYCITGDGGLQMNIQELQTVFTENLPIKIIVVNNSSLGKISEIQRADYGERYMLTNGQSGYTSPDFQKITEAYGIKAKTIDDYHKLDEVKDWFSDDDPCLINILLPDDTLLLPKMNWNEKEMKPDIEESAITRVLEILRGQ